MNDHTMQTSGGLVSLPAIVELAGSYKLSPTAFAFTFRSIAMPQPHTEAEFVSCCLVAKEHGLNPLTKEIYFMRDKTGAIQAIVGVDGWIKKCNEHPKFDGIEFEDMLGQNGQALAIKARIYRSDRGRPTEVTEYMAECVQNRSKPGPWQSHPNRMLRHRALIQCARIAFGFAGIMDRDEFDQWQTEKRVTDITPQRAMVADVPEIPEVPAIVDGPETGAPAPAGCSTDDEPFSAIEEARLLATLADELAVAGDAKHEVAEQYAELLPRLSDAGRRAAERMLEV